MANWSKQQLVKMRRNIHLAAESLPDETLVETPELAEAWAYPVQYAADKRVQDDGRLFKCLQAHTSQADWRPSATPSLWAEVPRPGDGSKERPIPYNGGMELEEGLYYAQDGVEYYCFRGTGVPVYNPLADLVGLYVEVAEQAIAE